MAVQIKRLGAQQVMLVYRRGQQDIPATAMELQLALQYQVQLICWAQPVKIFLNPQHQVTGMRFEKTAMHNNRLGPTGTTFDLTADVVFKAIGQQLDAATYPDDVLRRERGKIWVDANFQTSMARVYAGGDCVMRDPDLTVYAVQHGKLAARAMHTALQQREVHHG
jgi:glutamate synthase (NADPH/NADH) small chain